MGRTELNDVNGEPFSSLRTARNPTCTYSIVPAPSQHPRLTHRTTSTVCCALSLVSSITSAIRSSRTYRYPYRRQRLFGCSCALYNLTVVCGVGSSATRILHGNVQHWRISFQEPTDMYDLLHETGVGTLQHITRSVPMKALPHTAAPSSLVGTGRDIFLSIDLRYSLFFMCGIRPYTECSFPPERVGFLH